MASYETTISRTSRRFYTTGTETITGRLDQYVLRALPQDLLTTLRGVALDELNKQIDIENNPSQIIVDGRPVSRRGIIEATRSVSLRFADTRMLLAATRDAYTLLRQVTRLQTPAQNSIVARDNFYLYLNGKPIGKLPQALTKISENTLTTKSVLRVVGPLVNYGRVLYWSPIGRSKVMGFRTTVFPTGKQIHHYDSLLQPRFKPLRARTLRRIANQMPGADKAANLRTLLSRNAGAVEGTGQIVKRLMRRDRRYKALHISDGWINYPPAKNWGKTSKDDRVPSISVQMAKRGAVSVISLL